MNRPLSDFDALQEDLHKIYDGDPGTARRSPKFSRRLTPRWPRAGAAPQSPPEDWPVPRFGGGAAAWQAAMDDLAAAQEELEGVVASLKPDQLLRWIGDQRDPSLGSGLTVGSVIRGLLQHHTYHGGQIAILKRAAE